MKVRKAVIPAAGMGTRFLPATKAQPKEMLPLVDKPVIQYVVEEAVASGITDILIITGKGKHAIENHFNPSPELETSLRARGNDHSADELRRISELADISFVLQPEPLGLGHAVSLAQKHVGDEPFAVLLGDTIFDSKIPCTRQLAGVFERKAGSVIACHEVPPADVSRWGIIKGKPVGEGVFAVEDLVEKPAVGSAPSNLAIAARYMLTPGIFDCIKGTKPGKNGEIQLTDALKALCAKEPVFASIVEGKWYDIGTKLDYAVTFAELGLKHPQVGTEFRKHLEKLVK